MINAKPSPSLPTSLLPPQAINDELLQLKQEIKRRDKMTIDERAEEIKREVDKEIEIENDTGWVPPPPLVRYPGSNTETKPMPLYLASMFYEKTENVQKYHLPHMVDLPSVPTPPPYYLHPNISHVFGQPSPHLDFSMWFLEDTNLRAIIKVRIG